jgi:hypothetical protein
LLIGKRYIWGIALGLAISEILVNLLKGFEVFYFFRILPFRRREAIFLLALVGLESIIFGILTKLGFPIFLYLFIGAAITVGFWILSFSKSPNEADRENYEKALNYISATLKNLWSKF